MPELSLCQTHGIKYHHNMSLCLADTGLHCGLHFLDKTGPNCSLSSCETLAPGLHEQTHVLGDNKLKGESWRLLLCG